MATVSVITALVYHVVVPASYPLLRLAGVALAAQVLGGDLGAAEADAWLRGGGGEEA